MLFTNINQIQLIPKKEKKIKKLVYKRINNKESYKFDVEYINKMEN